MQPGIRMSLFAAGTHPQDGTHPNLHKFEGRLALIDKPSDGAPNGARGHLVLVQKVAAVAALPSLLGMAVDFAVNWKMHDVRQKCGIITDAWIDGIDLMISGYVYKRDFPEIAPYVQTHQMGLSFEIADAHIEDMSATVWVITGLDFTGAAILLREKSAYRTSTFKLIS